MSNPEKTLRERYRAAASNLLIDGPEWEEPEAPTTRPPQDAEPQPWDPSAWDGLSEGQAFEDRPTDVVDALGREIASVTWEHGSWASVYECRGRFFAADEVDFVECASAAEAFDRAGVGRDWFDEIEGQWVDDEYLHLVEEDKD